MLISSTRCHWAQSTNQQLVTYHDQEWGHPEFNSYRLFELLSLELMQAGLSWATVLKKRTAFEAAFQNFDYHQVATMEPELPKLLQNAAIIRNQRKLTAVIKNAQAIVKLETAGTNFSDFLWDFVHHEPIIHDVPTPSAVPKTIPLTDHVSHELKHQGFQFTGPVVCYSFFQAAGLINDHENQCPFKEH
ncbi:DNA-3-methyladenine glycosylase I [Fructilactobacillus myrtifloralis]|uniref:DNA-3-methyladenine glycosylase I n=1 Tax=Fructilactobacillus myrtifloralis TaxID=2940301 RepID=A0ABY5BLQ8_9LACO|nr:DNA-3-methyladenine glycosylase I [Fructilactobacillus myrtifloralis]USS84613.1 DNA-3-methyladenine glycosylase I [Fructilactobacillus myrtifloralis]